MPDLYAVSPGALAHSADLNQYYNLLVGTISAKNYGAIGNGVSDDTTALQNALNALVAGPARVLVIPAGTYKITSPLTVGLCNAKTIRGMGRDATMIRQFTANTPVLQFTAENTYGINLWDLTLDYNTQQTSGQTNSIALNWNVTGGTGSGWYYWNIRNVAFRKAQTGLAVSGTGTLPIFNFRCEGLWFQDMAASAIRLVSPTPIGQMPNTFENTLITNGGIVPTAQAIVGNVVSMTFNGLSVTNWQGRILYANGGSFVRLQDLHIETCTYAGQYGVLLAMDDLGILTVDTASITTVITDGTNDHWVILVGAGATCQVNGLYLAVTNTSGSGALFNASAAGARVYATDVIDVNGTVSMPVAAGDLAARANVVQWQPSGHASYLGSLSGLVSYYRFGEWSGTAAKDVKGVQDGVYQGAPTLGTKGLIYNDPDTAVALNGSSQYVSIADNAAQHVGNVFSIAMWINLAAIKLQQLIYGNASGSYSWEVTAGNVLRIVRDSVAEIALGTVNPTIGVPQHVVWTRSGTGADKIYLNGVDVTGAVTSTGPLANSNGPRIGSTGFSSYLGGVVDECALFNRALTATEVATLFSLGRGY